MRKSILFLVLLVLTAGCAADDYQPGNTGLQPRINSKEAWFYTKICSECHALPDPKHFTFNNWKSVVAIMVNRRKIQGFEPLSKRDRELLLSYLKKNAKQNTWLQNSPEAKLFSSRCGVCHVLPNPTKYNYKQWMKILTQMEGKIDKTGKIKPLARWERNYLLSYLRKHVKEIIKVEGLDTPEAKTYAKQCSQCHALKDPSSFSYEKWKDEIIPEMEEIMEGEEKTPITDTEREEILAFLKKRAKNK